MYTKRRPVMYRSILNCFPPYFLEQYMHLRKCYKKYSEMGFFFFFCTIVFCHTVRMLPIFQWMTFWGAAVDGQVYPH